MRVFAVVLGVLVLASVGSAASVFWAMNPAPTDFIGGGGFTPSDWGDVSSIKFTWDTDLDVWTDWEIVVTATSGNEFPAGVYTPANSSVADSGNRWLVRTPSSFMLVAGLDPAQLDMRDHAFITNGLHQQTYSGGPGHSRFTGARSMRLVNTPEPATAALLGLGALGLGWFARRRRNRRMA